MRSNEEVRSNLNASDKKWDAFYETGLHPNLKYSGKFIDRWGLVKYKLISLEDVIHYIEKNKFCNSIMKVEVSNGKNKGILISQNKPYKDPVYGERYFNKIERLFGIIIKTNYDLAKFVAHCRFNMDCDYNWVIEELDKYIENSKEILLV